MVFVPIGPTFTDTPAFPQIGSNHPINGQYPFLFPCFRRGEFQMIPDEIIHEPGNVFGIIQIPFFKPGYFFFRHFFFQKSLPFPIIPDIVANPYLEPIYCILSILLQKILIGQMISLIPVFPGKHQYFVFKTVIKADAVGNYMIDIHIPGFKQPLCRYGFLRIGTLTILFLP